MVGHARSFLFVLLMAAGLMGGTGCIVSSGEEADVIGQELYEAQDEDLDGTEGQGGAGGGTQDPDGVCTTISCRNF